MALKSTSSPIAISTSHTHTIPVNATAVSSKTVDLQLNPLDNEVFVVTAVKIDFNGLPTPDLSGALTGDQHLQVSILKNEPATGTAQDIRNSNCVASSRLNIFSSYDGVLPINMGAYTVLEESAMDTPPANQAYLDIIATDNFVIQMSNSADLASQTQTASVRVYGYRAKADASTYAALVQSEMLSTA